MCFKQLLFSFFCLISFSSFADSLIVEPEMGRKPLVDTISHAHHSIDLIMYGFTDPTLLNTLVKQRLQGREVNVIIEPEPYKAQDENVNAIQSFQKHHIHWKSPTSAFYLIHQKTLIIDSKTAIVMTFNFTRGTFRKERNFALIIDDPELVQEIHEAFSADWSTTKFTPHAKNLIWSPHNSREKIIALINDAKKSLKIYAQQISDYKIIGALAKAAKRGVDVKILTSNHLRAKQEKYLVRAGVQINYSNEYIVHAKVIIADSQQAIVGSINFTTSSLDKNRELSVITRDKNITQELLKIFEHDWENSAHNNKNLFSHMGIDPHTLIHFLKRLNKALVAAAID